MPPVGSQSIEAQYAPIRLQSPSTAVSASISISIAGSINALTSTIVVAGLSAPKNSACARPYSAHREISVTNILVRTIRFLPAPSFANASSTNSRHRLACA